MAFANRFRQSKFKHVFGKGAKREGCYDNIRITKSSWDSTFCAVNPKYIAIITDAAGGGAFIVLSVDKPCRVERDPPLVTGHKAAVLDIQWCPHDDDFIASASEDCTAKVWKIESNSFTDGNLTECYRDLVGHNRRVGLVLWHPSAYMVLLTAGADNKVIIWNVEEQEMFKEIEFPDNVFSASWNFVGSRFVCSCKDKVVRVVDARTGEFIAENQLHEGSKPQQVVFLKDGRVFSTGFSRMSERQSAIWNGETLEEIERQELDNSNGVLFPFYDPDVNLVYLVGKGDSNVRYFEVSEEAPYLHYLNMYQSSDPQRGMGMMPKRGLDVASCEIARLYKLHQRGLCEPICFTVPRKSELFQDDLYPDTSTDSYAITADEWFFDKKDSEPVLASLRPEGMAQPKERKRAPERRTHTTARAAPAVADTALDVPRPQPQAAHSSQKGCADDAPALTAAQLKALLALPDRLAKLEDCIERLADRLVTVEAAARAVAEKIPASRQESGQEYEQEEAEAEEPTVAEE